MSKSKLDLSHDPRLQSALLILDIQEDLWLESGKGNRKPKGYAQLQRIFEYLVNTEEPTGDNTL